MKGKMAGPWDSNSNSISLEQAFFRNAFNVSTICRRYNNTVTVEDLTFDVLINVADASEMRSFLSDAMLDKEMSGGGKSVSIPFGRQDCTVFRKVMSSDDMVQEFAPALRTNSQAEAFRIALQMLGDLPGFGITYFDFDDVGYMKTATEVSSDNSALMRNIAKHEHVLERSIAQISCAVMHVARGFGENLPEEGCIKVTFDNSIITDTSAAKLQDMAEVGLTLWPWE